MQFSVILNRFTTLYALKNSYFRCLYIYIYIYIYIKYNLRSFNKRVTKIVEEEKEKVAAIELERKIVRCESVEMLTPGSEGC